MKHAGHVALTRWPSTPSGHASGASPQWPHRAGMRDTDYLEL